MAQPLVPTAELVEVTALNAEYAHKGNTVTLTFPATPETEAMNGKTYTVVMAHDCKHCSGYNCAKHPLYTPLFRSMDRGDVTWGSLLCR
jgi:hypothetical protein